MKPEIFGLIRHALTTAGGVLLVKPELLTNDELTTVVSAIMILVGALGSVYDKRQTKKVLRIK